MLRSVPLPTRRRYKSILHVDRLFRGDSFQRDAAHERAGDPAFRYEIAGQQKIFAELAAELFDQAGQIDRPTDYREVEPALTTNITVLHLANMERDAAAGQAAPAATRFSLTIQAPFALQPHHHGLSGPRHVISAGVRTALLGRPSEILWSNLRRILRGRVSAG